MRVFADYATGRGGPGDRALAANPFFLAFGYAAGILTCLLAGATIYAMAAFDPEAVLQLIETERLT